MENSEVSPDLFKFVLDKVGSQNVPLWQMIKAVTDFYATYHILNPESSLYSRYYEEINLIGKGGFGAVYECKHKLDGRTYAVKLIPFSDKGEKNTFQELRAIFLIHPNILRYHKAWVEDNVPNHLRDLIVDSPSAWAAETTSDDASQSPSSDSAQEHPFTKTLYLLMEHCRCTLADELEARKDFTGSEMSKIFRDVAEGLCYIHSKGLIHGDISTTNIFLGFDGVARIGDFGLVVEDDGVTRAIGGKPKYHPPELKSPTPGQMVTKGVWTKGCDVYALGVVMLEIVYSITTDMELDSMMKRKEDLPPPLQLCVDDFEVLKDILNSSASERPSAQNILAKIG